MHSLWAVLVAVSMLACAPSPKPELVRPPSVSPANATSSVSPGTCIVFPEGDVRACSHQTLEECRRHAAEGGPFTCKAFDVLHCFRAFHVHTEQVQGAKPTEYCIPSLDDCLQGAHNALEDDRLVEGCDGASPDKNPPTLP